MLLTQKDFRVLFSPGIFPLMVVHIFFLEFSGVGGGGASCRGDCLGGICNPMASLGAFEVEFCVWAFLSCRSEFGADVFGWGESLARTWA